MNNLVTDKIWQFRDDKGNTFLLSLLDILYIDTPLYHAPTPAYLIPIQHELLASILQVAADSLWKKGLSKKNFIQLIQTEHYQGIKPIIDQIVKQLNIIEGFNLVGIGAFMQMPTALRFEGKQSQIARLIWPFIPNVNGSSKGLRRLPETPICLGPALTALYLFSSCVLSKGGSQYWSIGNLAGRILLHQHQGKTLRQQLFSAVLPGFSLAWQPLQPLPWVPDCKNNGGLEFEDLPPFANYLFSKRKIKGTANIRFYQSRAIILDPPESGKCDVTESKTTVFKSCRYLTDQAIYDRVIQQTGYRALRKAGILTQMYVQRDHPSVANYDDGESTTEPALLNLKAWNNSNNQKIIIPQTITSTISACPQIQNKGLNISFFHLKYVAQKQDVKDLIFFNAQLTFSSSTKHELFSFLHDIVATAVSRVRAGLYSVLATKKRDKLGKAESKLLTDEIGIFHLFIVRRLQNTNIESQNEKQENITHYLATRCESVTRKWWFEWLDANKSTNTLSLLDHRKISLATRIVTRGGSMYPDIPVLESLPVVRAGRAFAAEFVGLTTAEKNACLSLSRTYTSRSFWKCMNKALTEDSNAYRPMFEQLLHLLKYIQPVTNCTDLGSLLSHCNKTINASAVEQLLRIDQQNLLIEHINHILKQVSKSGFYPAKIDFGLLCYDLKTFHFDKDKVMRRWAYNYFTLKQLTNEKESDV